MNLWGPAVKCRSLFCAENLRRAAAYRELYRIEEKFKDSDACYRYYSTQRPVDIGTFPKPQGNTPLAIVNYGDDLRRPVAGGTLLAWEELLYRHPLTAAEMEGYELKPCADNPGTWSGQGSDV